MLPGDAKSAATYFHGIIRLSREMGTYLPIGPVLQAITKDTMVAMAKLEVDALDAIGDEFWIVYNSRVEKMPRMYPTKKKLEKELDNTEKDYCINCGKSHKGTECEG